MTMNFWQYFVLFQFFCVSTIWATSRYYGSYMSFGSGDTMIQPFHAHGGTKLPNRKWNLECLDGEALVGIADVDNDFIRLQNTWCKFTFPFKPPSNGLYPYYSGCHVRNLTDNFHCYDPARHAMTSSTFITAMWANNLNWWQHRIPLDDVAPYKCCKTPTGYYIDYVSCYYVPTHDLYFEYYDNPNQFIVYCVQGYVMTGISKKINPYTKEYRYEWIQCCRVGVGRPIALAPPVTFMPSGVPAYSSPGSSPPSISAAYRSQYQPRLDDASFQENTFENVTWTSPKKAALLKHHSAIQPDLDQLLFNARAIRPGTLNSIQASRENDRWLDTEKRRLKH